MADTRGVMRRLLTEAERNPLDMGQVPEEVRQAGQDFLAKLQSVRTCGDSGVVAGWWVETHTLGCRYEAGTPEEDWWDEHWAIYDELIRDGKSFVDGDPADGIFVSYTPPREQTGG